MGAGEGCGCSAGKEAVFALGRPQSECGTTFRGVPRPEVLCRDRCAAHLWRRRETEASRRD
eukprot:scaffold533_cov226-Pinguiococcus_pyrenoidosus.AAC.3